MASKIKIKKSKSGQKPKIFKGLTSAVLSSSHIELFENHELILEGCKGVGEYTDEFVRLKLSSGSLILNGKGLIIKSFEEKTLVIKGKISSLEFD